MWYVYIISNTINNKIYVGKTNNLKDRWNGHKSEAKQLKYISIIHYAMNKYNASNFSIQSIEEHDNENDALKAEKFFIEYFKSLGAELYNISAGGDGRSMPCSLVTKKKMQSAHQQIDHSYTIDPRNTEAEKYCPACNTVKPRTEFYNGNYWCCKLCKRTRAKLEKKSVKIAQPKRIKLNENIALSILESRKLGKTLGEISLQFGLDRGGISKICNGKTWKLVYEKFNSK
jgi:group I intron endonuclease